MILVPMCLSRQGASNDIHHDLPDLTLTLTLGQGQVKVMMHINQSVLTRQTH